MEDIGKLFYMKNKKSKKKYKSRIVYEKQIQNLTQNNKISTNKIPQIINNYDVKVNITKEKGNNININNMNINSLYSQSDSLNNFCNIDKKSNIFKNIRLNNYLNKTSQFIRTEFSPNKVDLNLDKFDNNYLNSYKKETNYEEVISKLKNEFKSIEDSHNKDYLSKTQNLKNDINFNNNDILNELNIKLLKINDSININKENKKPNKNLNDLFLLTDISLLKEKEKNNNKKARSKSNSREKKISPYQMKKTLNLTNNNFLRKENSNISRNNNFNKIYDNLINKKNIIYKRTVNSKSSDKRKDLDIKNNISSNTTINSRSRDKSKKLYDDLNNIKNKRQRDYYECKLFGNLNRLTFKRTLSHKEKIYKKYLGNNNLKICNNISFSYYISKFDKYNNYFKDKKYTKNNYNIYSTKSITIINEIINIQNKMIAQYKKNEGILKNELVLANIKINELKNAFFKFIYYLNNEKAKSLNNLKKYISINSQLMKENQILKEIMLSDKLSLFNNNDDKKEEKEKDFFQLYFEKTKKQKIFINDDDNKLTNQNKTKYSNLNRKKSNKNQKQNSKKENSFDFVSNFTPYLDKKKSNIFSLYKENTNANKKLCYLHKKNNS